MLFWIWQNLFLAKPGADKDTLQTTFTRHCLFTMSHQLIVWRQLINVWRQEGRSCSCRAWQSAGRQESAPSPTKSTCQSGTQTPKAPEKGLFGGRRVYKCCIETCCRWKCLESDLDRYEEGQAAAVIGIGRPTTVLQWKHSVQLKMSIRWNRLKLSKSPCVPGFQPRIFQWDISWGLSGLSAWGWSGRRAGGPLSSPRPERASGCSTSFGSGSPPCGVHIRYFESGWWWITWGEDSCEAWVRAQLGGAKALVGLHSGLPTQSSSSWHWQWS